MHNRWFSAFAYVVAIFGLAACAPGIQRATVSEPLAEQHRADLRVAIRDTEWRYSVSRDAVTDAERRVARSTATRSPTRQDDSEIILRCTVTASGAELELFVATETYLSNRDIKADYRLGSRPAKQNSYWTPSTDGDAAFATFGDIKAIIEGMLIEPTLLVRLYDFRGTSYSYTFSTDGFDIAYELLGCHPS